MSSDFLIRLFKMVREKEEALSKLGSAKLDLTQLEAVLENKNLADHAHIHQHTLAA